MMQPSTTAEVPVMCPAAHAVPGSLASTCRTLALSWPSTTCKSNLLKLQVMLFGVASSSPARFGVQHINKILARQDLHLLDDNSAVLIRWIVCAKAAAYI